jgi:murein DD-endopeptidase MepM/ murein hydrolase activator NlpD
VKLPVSFSSRSRRAAAALAALAAFATLAPAHAAGAATSTSTSTTSTTTPDKRLVEAEAKITATRRAVQAATVAYTKAQAEYGRLDGEVAKTQRQIAKLRTERARNARIARRRAIAAYIRPSLTIEDVVSTKDVLAAARRAELLDGANAQSNAAIHRLSEITDDMSVREKTLHEQRDRQKKTVARLKAQEKNVTRLLLAAVQAEQDLRIQLIKEQLLREYADRLERARDAARGGGGPHVGEPGIIITTGDWVCPVQGPVAFIDSWGAPRSGGRKHKGVDMFAAEGTPLVAVESGSVFFQGDPLGGNAAYVQGRSGISYYYAHLRDYVGSARTVKAGELIGHVGHTGDADGGSPHLHFEIRPGGPGAPAIPPYPTVAAHC